jgi:N-acetylmuramoyl-L-alanine amidase
MKIIESPSPNHGPRPAGASIDLLVIHGTAGTDAGDLSWCRSPQAGVSYHYLILRDGTVHRLVPEERRAWHSGASSWQGRSGCNNYGIGIGLSNRGPGEPYTAAQYASLRALIADIQARRPAIVRDRIVGHHQVSPGRKSDPWPHFDWSEIDR